MSLIPIAGTEEDLGDHKFLCTGRLSLEVLVEGLLEGLDVVLLQRPVPEWYLDVRALPYRFPIGSFEHVRLLGDFAPVLLEELDVREVHEHGFPFGGAGFSFFNSFVAENMSYVARHTKFVQHLRECRFVRLQQYTVGQE